LRLCFFLLRNFPPARFFTSARFSRVWFWVCGNFCPAGFWIRFYVLMTFTWYVFPLKSVFSTNNSKVFVKKNISSKTGKLLTRYGHMIFGVLYWERLKKSSWVASWGLESYLKFSLFKPNNFFNFLILEISGDVGLWVRKTLFSGETYRLKVIDTQNLGPIKALIHGKSCGI
jgi:hypothetical protein